MKDSFKGRQNDSKELLIINDFLHDILTLSLQDHYIWIEILNSTGLYVCNLYFQLRIKIYTKQFIVVYSINISSILKTVCLTFYLIDF